MPDESNVLESYIGTFTTFPSSGEISKVTPPLCVSWISIFLCLSSFCSSTVHCYSAQPNLLAHLFARQFWIRVYPQSNWPNRLAVKGMTSSTASHLMGIFGRCKLHQLSTWNIEAWSHPPTCPAYQVQAWSCLPHRLSSPSCPLPLGASPEFSEVTLADSFLVVNHL